MDLEDFTGVVQSIQDWFDTHDEITIADVEQMLPSGYTKQARQNHASRLLVTICSMGCFQTRKKGQRRKKGYRGELVRYRKKE